MVPFDDLGAEGSYSCFCPAVANCARALFGAGSCNVGCDARFAALVKKRKEVTKLTKQMFFSRGRSEADIQ